MVKSNICNITIGKIKKQGVRTLKDGKIKAVHDDDLIEFLKSIKEYEKIVKGESQCCFCDDVITLQNIQSIFPLDGEVKYCCNSKKCYRLLVKGDNE